MSLDLIDAGAEHGIRAMFTTRAGGVSTGTRAGLNLGAASGDDPAAVRANRRLLCRAAGLAEERVTLGNQVHGTDVRRIDAPTRPGRFTGALAGWPDSDGLVTDRPGLALAVLGADCLPVLLWRRDRPVVAAAHAGWRGLAGGILGNAVRALGDPARTAATIGPGVGPCCYPVDAGLRDRFAARFGRATVRGDAVDLAGAARVDLLAAGIPAAGLEVVGVCTSCDARRFYSYRRDGAGTGRQAGVIVVESA